MSNTTANGFIAGAIVFACSIGLAFAQASSEGYSAAPQQQTTQKQTNAKNWLPPVFKPEDPDPQSSPERCTDGDTTCREQEDLKAQRRMADAAEKQLDLVAYQNFITTVESGLLLITIIFTGIAALAATRAARAADRAVDVTAAAELPILQIDNVIIGSPEGRYESPDHRLDDALFTVYVRNYGKTPAFIDHFVINAIVRARLPHKPEYQTFSWLMGPRPIEHGEKKPFTEAHYRNERPWGKLNEVIRGRKILWVYGFFDYYDFLGELHRRGFCSRWDVVGKCFHAYRDPQYDYQEDRIKPEENPFATAFSALPPDE